MSEPIHLLSVSNIFIAFLQDYFGQFLGETLKTVLRTSKVAGKRFGFCLTPKWCKLFKTSEYDNLDSTGTR